MIGIKWIQPQNKEDISCRRKKFPVTERNFMSYENISLFCLQEDTSLTGRSLLSQEGISCHRKTFPFRRRNFLSQDEISCHRKKFPLYISHTILNFYLYLKCSYIHYTGEQNKKKVVRNISPDLTLLGVTNA